MNSNIAAKVDVLVVGAGPTGLTVALSLLSRGRQVAIVDKLQEGDNTSRAAVVYPATLEELDAYGVSERPLTEGLPKRLQESLPTVEQLEAELKDSNEPDPVPSRLSKLKWR